jgi:hypothetical protein
MDYQELILAAAETIEMGVSIIFAIIVGVVSAVISYALTPDFNDKKTGSQTNLRSAEEPQDVVYGIVTKGGVLVFINGTGDDNESLHEILVVAGHAIQGIGAIHFNSETVELTETLTLPGPTASSALINSSVAALRTAAIRDKGERYAENAVLRYQFGEDDQVADTTIIADNPQWTTEHRLRGLAYIYAKLSYNPDVYTSFIPNITGEIIGKKDVYDPRDGVERWTMNPALIIADILETIIKVPRSNIDQAALIVAANICDETATRKDSSQELRFTANGTFKLDGDWEDYLTPFINAMAGAVIEWGGNYYIQAGAWTEPVIDITDDDLMGPISRNISESDQSRSNAAKGKFVSPANFDKSTEFPPVKDAVAISEDGGEVNWLELDLDMVNSHTQAQRLASIFLNENRLDETVVLDLPLYLGLDVRPWDNVRYTSDIFGIDQTYRVIEHNVIPRGGRSPMVVVEVVLKRHESAIYDWDPATQEKDIQSAKTNLPGSGSKSPTGISYSINVIALDDDHKAATVDIDWTDPVDSFVEIEIEVTLAVESREQDSDAGTAGNQPGAWVDVVIAETRTIASGVETAVIDIEDETLTNGPYEFQEHAITKARIRAKIDDQTYGPWISAAVA